MYPTSTTQALAGNLSKIASAFLPMFDPSVAAQAEEARRNRELFPLKLRGAQLDNNLTSARISTEGAQKGYYEDQSGLVRDKRSYQQTQTQALDDLYGGGGPLPTAPTPASQAVQVPFTNYSTGAAVGGPDEMQDKWTNQGYSATGKNLTPGMVAVNPSRYGIGTVFKDPATGEVFIAGDKHGNSNPDVVDFYQTPETYQRTGGMRNLQVIGREDKVGASPEEVAAQLAKWAGTLQPVGDAGMVLPPLDESALPPDAIPVADSKIANSGLSASRIALTPEEQARLAAVAGLNPEIFMGGQARAEALRGGFSEARGREIALAQGLMPSQTTAITPEYQVGRDVMANNADLMQATEVARINQQGGLAQEDIRGRYGLAGDLIKPMLPGANRGAGGASAMPGAPESFNDMQKLDQEAMAASFQNFGVKMEDGVPENDPFAAVRQAWQESYRNLRIAGKSPADAAANANVHHFGTPQPGIVSQDTFRLGFGSDPEMPALKNPNPLQVPTVQQAQPQAASNFAAAIPAILGMLGLGGGQQETPIPVSGAEAPKAQEAAIPQTGPKPQGKRLGDAETQRKNEETAGIGSAYNDKTLQSLLKSGVPIEDIAATAFAGDDGNASALLKAITSAGPAAGSYSGYGIGPMPTGPAASIKDIRNALQDAAALQRAGIDPAVIRQYMPGEAPAKPDVDALLLKYR